MATERSVLVRLKANVDNFVTGMATARTAVKGLTRDIDTTNDRVAWLSQSILALGPTLVPIGAAATPVLSGLATQMTVAGGAAGVMALGLVGVGDALEKLNKYQLDPSEANLKSMSLAMTKIGPAGKDFVEFLDTLGPELNKLRELAREGMFPGMEEGITSLMTQLPEMQRMVQNVAEGVGQLSAEAGAGLAGPRFEQFFEYLQVEAKPLLIEMGHTIGNFVDGLAAMLVAFGPLTASYSSGFEAMSKSFANWAHGLQDSESFADFVAYVQDSIPKVLDLIGALSDFFVALVRAAAPVGSIMLPAFTQFLNVLTEIFESPIGTFFVGTAVFAASWGRVIALVNVTTGGFAKNVVAAALGLKAFSGALVETENGMKRIDWQKLKTPGVASAIGKTATAASLLAVSMNGLDEKVGLTHTTMLAMSGTMLGGWWGTGIGATIGFIWDMVDATSDFDKAMQALNTTLATDAPSQSTVAQANAELKAAQKALDDLKTERANLPPLPPNKFSGPDTRAADLDRQIADAEKKLDAATVKFNEMKQAWLNSDEDTYLRTVQGLNDTEIAAYHAAEALEAARGAAAKTADEFLTLGESLNDPKTTLGDWVAELDAQATALRNFRINAKEAAKRGVSDALIAELQAAGPEGALRLQQLADPKTSQAIIDAANAAVRRRQKQKDIYTDVFGGIPGEVKTSIDLDGADEAIRQAKELRGLLGLPTSVTYTAPVAGGTKPGDQSDWTRMAEGGTVPVTGLPYADRHPYLLADGEEVVSNRYGQADRHRELLKAINANRLADGGTVSRYATPAKSGWSAGPVVSLSDLHAVMASVGSAPTVQYGDVHVQPHDYSEFVRQQRQDLARASTGGLRR